MVGTFEYEFFRGGVHLFWTAFCSKWTAKSCFSPKSVFELQLHQQWVIWTAKSPIRRQILRRFQIRCQKHRIFSESWVNLEKPTIFFRCVCSFLQRYIHTRYFKTNFIFVFPISDMTQKSKLRPLAPLNAQFYDSKCKISVLKFSIFSVFPALGHCTVVWEPAYDCFSVSYLFGAFWCCICVLWYVLMHLASSLHMFRGILPREMAMPD